ncbi:hypothetical protein MVEN_00542600 [Mycena venus]|uniref:Uncharacterized protein n=1 Tax=Mycena venus TaxID=2733690 RepID=A0A8H7D7T8_9AGAR|nr:hypothetical protein MVEN_00542600 [Mycena venus]
MLAAALAVLATPVHSTLFPYPWGSTLHAFRISLVFHNSVQMSGSRLSWGAHMFGFLLMCWGGSFASHMLLSLPAPQLYALGPWINYSAVHLFFTVLFHYFPIPDLSLTNTVLFPLDGLLRVNSVLHSLSHLANPSVNPLLVASPPYFTSSSVRPPPPAAGSSAARSTSGRQIGISPRPRRCAPASGASGARLTYGPAAS